MWQRWRDRERVGIRERHRGKLSRAEGRWTLIRRPMGISSDRHLVVELIAQRWLRNDGVEADAIDRLALELGARALDLNLVAGPVIGIAEGIFERFPICAIEHHWLTALEEQRELVFRVLALSDRHLLDVADRRNDGAVLHVG